MPKFLNFLNLRKYLAVCFSKHESPFGSLAAWIRVKVGTVSRDKGMVFLGSIDRTNTFNIPAEMRKVSVHFINVFMLNFEVKVSQRFFIWHVLRLWWVPCRWIKQSSGTEFQSCWTLSLQKVVQSAAHYCQISPTVGFPANLRQKFSKVILL